MRILSAARSLRRPRLATLALTALGVAALGACGARSPLEDLTRRVAHGGSSSASSTNASSVTSSVASVVSSTTSSEVGPSVTSSTVSSSGAGGFGGTGPQIISQTPESFIEAETSVAAGTNGLVIAAWIGIPQSNNSFIGYAVSMDDGATWGPPQRIDAPNGRVSSDPVLAVDAQNNFYLSWVGFRAQGMSTVDMHVYVAKAPVGKTAFDPPVDASGMVPNNALVDKPWITVTDKGTLLVTYAEAFNSYDLKVARSVDQGASWGQATIASDPSQQVFRNLAMPCTSPFSDRVYATFIAFGSTSLEVHLAHSDDDGVTWTGGAQELRVNAANEPVAFDDPSCVTNGKEVWVTYGLSKDSPNDMDSAKSFAVRLAHSPDQGASIDTYQNVHDPKAGALFIHPFVTLEDTGALDFIYWTGNFDMDDNGSFRRSRAPVPAGGALPSVVVAQPETFLGARSDARWLGDYAGGFTRKGELFMSFVDNSQGASHIAFAKANVP